MTPFPTWTSLATSLTRFVHGSAGVFSPQTKLTFLRRKLRSCWRKGKENIVYRLAATLLAREQLQAHPLRSLASLARACVLVIDAASPTDRADASNILIVGLNGEVSRARGQTVKPGDRILVMPRFDSKNLQLAKDVTQVLYQMAIAVKVTVGL